MTRLAFLAALVLLAGYVIGSPRNADSGEKSTGYYVIGVSPKPERGSRAKCHEEAALAERAWEMTKALLREPVTLTIRGVDRFGRLLADVTLSSGEDLGAVLKREGLARDWPLEWAWCE